MTPVVGMISDFGEGPYTGIMRAVVRSIAGNADIIDLDHTVPSYSVLAGAYVTLYSYQWLPRGSIVLVVVDPGVGSAREAIAVEAGDYYFVGPNNGVMFPAIKREGFKRGVALSPRRVVSLASERFRGKLFRPRWIVSSTFHGRDVFAPTAALIASGIDLEELGDPIDASDLRDVRIDYIERVEEGYKAMVVYIDKFGNVALSAREHSMPLSGVRRVAIETSIGTFHAQVGRTFSDVNPGDLVVYVNSFGHYEIAVNQGNASNKLSIDIGEKLIVIPLA
ncbi:MAG: SAM-dependent chlorinase/fluorinase [Desulfurococcales archaeon]|nr:SAM-dependent chlorinase/fluorinase [Desulfurococcales archaeon]